MARYDFTSRRLYVETALSPGACVALTQAQAHYLTNVLRLPAGAQVLAFNGRDGEWRCTLAASGRKSFTLSAVEMTRPQTAAYDLHYMFAPLKHARLDYMVQKAVEMGAGVLQPVLTRHTHVERLSLERMQANAVEAAEQCGILSIPRISPLTKLAALIADWPRDRLLIFCDEEAQADPATTLALAKAGAAASDSQSGQSRPLALLIGPEGGFEASERQELLAIPNVVRLSLGPRILRADTAAVAALTLVQAILGDWQA